MSQRLAGLLVAILSLCLLASCGERSGRRVVVYVALDRHLSRPVLKRYERRAGVRVIVQYDSEANKTVGLVGRLVAEARAGNVQCDVFWNNEILHTIRLKRRGLTEPYVPTGAAQIPPAFRDPEGHWTGFAARARVLIVNTEKVPASRMPSSIEDLADPAWKGRTCLARPIRGTTATHGAALFALDGEKKAQDFFRRLLDNDVGILLGNATVRDLVARGRYAFGLTDTDDAYAAIDRGDPVKMVFPDQDGRGTLVIPNTVCLIRGGPNGAEGRALIDYLTSAEVEEALARAAGRQIPLRPGVAVPEGHIGQGQIKATEVDYDRVAEVYDAAIAWIDRNFSH